METRNLALEKAVLGRLRRTYESKGYRFLEGPSPSLLPDFLHELAYRPDAVALKDDGGVVIGLKLDRSHESGRKLSQIADAVRGHKGWDFKLLFLAEQPDMVPSTLGDISAEALGRQLSEANLLWRAGHRRAALLIAWAAFEAAARTAVRRYATDERIDVVTPLVLIENAVTYGVLGNAAASPLRKVARTRSAIAHGDFSIEVLKSDFDAIIQAITEVMEEIPVQNAAH